MSPVPSPSGSPARPARGLFPTPSSVVAALCVAMLVAAGWSIRQAAGDRLWLDELYTTTLIDAPSLRHVWDGALRGVDGNPPLYLSLCWLLMQAVPGAPEQALRPFNLALLTVGGVLLYRVGRRLAEPTSVVAGLMVLCGTDGMVGYALLEVRTYALYLTLVVATLWATLRAVERPSLARLAALAGIGVLATLAHSFGGFYALATVGAGALVALVDRDRPLALALAAAAAPAAVTLATWIYLSLGAQLAVATPYGWIPVPDAEDLLMTLTGSLLLTPLLAVGLACAWVGRPPSLAALARCCAERRGPAVICTALFGFAALTVAGWVGSQLITPFFVPRYFIPNVIVAALLLIPGIAALRRGVDRRLFALAVAVCAVLGVGRIAAGPGTAQGAIPCRDAAGRFLEEGLADDGLPVVAESPHAWLPRARYAARQATLYPLDWDVVLRYPLRARNNAMDFHIMEILRDWAAPGTALATRVLTTEDILARHRHLLVLDEDARSWLQRLGTVHPLTARLLRHGPGCRLWDVTLAAPGLGGSAPAVAGTLQAVAGTLQAVVGTPQAAGGEPAAAPPR